MSNDKSKRNNNSGLASPTVSGILGSTAGMVWYNNLFADDTRRRKVFKKMKCYQSRILEELI
jgi:hypothetical protein